MTRFLLAVALAGALLTGSSHALKIPEGLRQFYSGNIFLDLCRRVPTEGACWGYIIGIADAMSANEKNDGAIAGWKACIPDSAPVRQLVDVVKRFRREHPEIRHLAASTLVGESLAEAFPCPTTAAQ